MKKISSFFILCLSLSAHAGMHIETNVDGEYIWGETILLTKGAHTIYFWKSEDGFNDYVFYKDLCTRDNPWTKDSEWIINPTEIGSYGQMIADIDGYYTIPIYGYGDVIYPELNGTCGDNLSWSFDTITNTLSIVGYGEMTSHPWKNISPALIKNISLPQGLASICDGAFAYCSSLTSITIPNSVKSIGVGAFTNCPKLFVIEVNATTPPTIQNSFNEELQVVFIPQGTTNAYINAWGTDYNYIEKDGLSLNIHVSTPGTLAAEIVKQGYMPAIVTKLTITGELNETDYAVMMLNMAQLYSLDLSSITNTAIPSSAFENKITLFELKLPNTLQSIGSNAFKGCKNLREVDLGNCVTDIEYGAFEGCSSLSSITLPQSLSTIGNNAFSRTSLTTVIIPDGVTNIGNDAFYGCPLADVTIGKSVTYISWGAFSECNTLNRVYYNGKIADWCNITFESEHSNPLYYAHNLYIQNNKVENLEIIDVPSIQPYAFVGADIQTVSLLSVPRVENDAFCGAKVKTAVINNGVELIAENAFRDCSDLQKITLGCNVTDMSYATFNGCNNLDTIICYGLTPAKVANNNGEYKQFNSVEPKSCLLIIPATSVVDYITAPVWGAYTNLQVHNLGYHTITVIPADPTMGYTSGGGVFVENSLTLLYAHANEGYVFKQWYDGSTENPRLYTVTSNITHIAFFEENVITGFENVKADYEYQGQKIIRDGQLLIIRDGVEYNALGIRL